MCFDKTGTLTEEGLDVLGVRATSEHNQPATFLPSITEKARNVPSQLLKCLASCHAISEVNGSLIGDPLDIKMFTYTSWVGESLYLSNVIGSRRACTRKRLSNRSPFRKRSRL
jgi:cation-transporting ATPase 13A3/4/5